MPIAHSALELRIQEPPSLHKAPPPVQGSSRPTTSGIFKRVQLGPHCTGTPPPHMFKLVHYEARMVGRLPVGILLECFLVWRGFSATVLVLCGTLWAVSIGCLCWRPGIYISGYLPRFTVNIYLITTQRDGAVGQWKREKGREIDCY